MLRPTLDGLPPKGEFEYVLTLRTGDTLPDHFEAALGCVIGNKDTYNLAAIKAPEYADYGDGEYGAMVAGDGKRGVATQDWSKGGKQW
jgi:hypothetical protein